MGKSLERRKIMPRATTEFQYPGKSVRITVPLASDEHIATAANELRALADKLNSIHNHNGRVSERVRAAQWEVQSTAMTLRNSVIEQKHYKTIR
jgi:hypothetical protein